MNDASPESPVPPEVYHASGAQGLRLIEPRVSTHGTAWVYAAADPVTAALFLGRHHDFILSSGPGSTSASALQAPWTAPKRA